MQSLLRIAALGLVVVAYPLVSTAQAPQSLAGRWKVNIAKSKADPGPLTRSQTGSWETVSGGGMKNVVDSVDVAGKKSHTEAVTMFDGNAVDVKGSARPTTRATISADGRTRTTVATGTNADGKSVNNTTVWERQ